MHIIYLLSSEFELHVFRLYRFTLSLMVFENRIKGIRLFFVLHLYLIFDKDYNIY